MQSKFIFFEELSYGEYRIDFRTIAKNGVAFLDAFYNRADFGYDVKRWRYTDVNQTIIDIVNQMGNDMIKNARIVQAASAIKSIAELALGVGLPSFIVGVVQALLDGTVKDTVAIATVARDRLIEDRKKLRSNPLAWSVVVSIMASRKQEIEMHFQGFI